MSQALGKTRIRITTAVITLACAAPSPGAGQLRSTPYGQAIRAAALLELAGRAPAPRRAVPLVARDLLVSRRGRRSEGATLIIIGGAAVVVGALAGGSGGTLLIVGGAVCLGYGFYLYSG